MIRELTSLKFFSESSEMHGRQAIELCGGISKNKLTFAPSYLSPILPKRKPNTSYYFFSSNTNYEDQVRHNKVTSPTIPPTAFESSMPSTTTGNKRILGVDDDYDIARLFKVALERAGFTVNTFNDPITALASYKKGLYDLLLLDIRMPQMDGFELYNKIKEIDDTVKMCFITAFEEYYEEFKVQFPHLYKSECYIRKPVRIHDLIRTVKSQLSYN